MADPNQAINYYTALLSVQMALLGFVIAGIVTLMQILQNAKPRRDIRLLIKQRALYTYVAYLGVLSLTLGTGSWAVGMTKNGPVLAFFLNSVVGGVLVFLCLTGLLWFLVLVYRARRLLEADEYLATYVDTIKPGSVSDYLFAAYAIRPDDALPKKSGQSGQSGQSREDGNAKSNNPLVAMGNAINPQELMKHLKVWDNHYKSVRNTPDPFQPIRDYLKDSAYKFDEYGSSQALKFYEELFTKAYLFVESGTDSQDYYYLGRYLADSGTEFFNIFRKMSSEKHKETMIRILQEQGMRFTGVHASKGLPPIIRALETIAKMADDDEIILCIIAIRELTDMYLKQHNDVSWQVVSTTFEEACSSVTRLAENYYLQPDNPLRTVPIMSYYTGEYRNVTAELMAFFLSYEDLGDRYMDTYPLHYFEAVEAVIESLLARYGEIVEAGQAGRGLNIAYHHFAHNLYTIYLKFGIDAIEHNKPELLALCLGNLRRIVKPARTFGLRDEHIEIVGIIIELALKGITSMGDIAVKSDGRTLTMYVLETLTKHADAKSIKQVMEPLMADHDIDTKKPAVKHLVNELKKLP
jgi:hypothetical protein